MNLQEFLEYIDPVFFRIPARELDISPSGDASQTKKEFIQMVTEQELETSHVLGMITELGLKNGLHKIPRAEYLGVAESAAGILNLNVSKSGNRVDGTIESNTLPGIEPTVMKAYYVAVESSGLTEFLKLIDSIHFRIPAKKIGIPTEDTVTFSTDSQVKAEFIKLITAQKHSRRQILGVMGELAIRNGLHKISPNKQEGILRASVGISSANTYNWDWLHYVGFAVAGYFGAGIFFTLIFGGAIPGLVGLLSIGGAVVGVLLTMRYKRARRAVAKTVITSTPSPIQASQSAAPEPAISPEPAEVNRPPTCPECGKENPSEARHCIACGVGLAPTTCKECGTDNLPEAKFCMSCGEKR